MGCGGSKPIDPAEYIVPQSEPEEPMLVRLTSCAGNFVELSVKPRPKSDEPIQDQVQLDGVTLGKNPTIENIYTTTDTTAIIQSMDHAIYETSRPFVFSFYDANRKLVAVLTGKKPPECPDYLERVKAVRATLYAKTPRAAATGHSTKTMSDGQTLHAIAELRPIFTADFVSDRSTASAVAQPPHPWEVGLYLAGPGGTFGEDPGANAPTAEGVPPFSLRPPDLRMRLAPGASPSDYPIRAAVVNPGRNCVALFQQADFRSVAIARNVDAIHVLALRSWANFFMLRRGMNNPFAYDPGIISGPSTGG